MERYLKMKRLIIDLDDTLCKVGGGNYEDALPIVGAIDRLRQYHKSGFEIIIHTSRNVRTYDGNMGKISAFTLPLIVDWLKKNDVPYDEIYVGKPWCGYEGFYVDDRSIRPSEFMSLDHLEILALLDREK